jgi:hypothetical protein
VRRHRDIPRNRFGVPLSEATDPANNPYDSNATGRWHVEPVADFSVAMVEKAVAARKKAVGDDDWPLIWSVERRDV